MTSQKKKLQISLTLLLILGFSWGYHTAMVVEELNLEGGDDESKSAKEILEDCVKQESDEGGKCHHLLENPKACQLSSSEDPKDDGLKNSQTLAQAPKKSKCPCDCDFIKGIGLDKLTPHEEEIDQKVKQAMNEYECTFSWIYYDTRVSAVRIKRIIEKESFSKLEDKNKIESIQRLFPKMTDLRTLEEANDKKKAGVTKATLRKLGILKNNVQEKPEPVIREERNSVQENPEPQNRPQMNTFVLNQQPENSKGGDTRERLNTIKEEEDSGSSNELRSQNSA